MAEATGGWGEMHNGDIRHLYSSLNIIRIKSWIRWTGHMEHIEAMINEHYR
jgi:hypothetical protein